MSESNPSSLWRDLREAVRGSEQDFTSGSLRRAVVLLAVPMSLEMVMESVFAVVDVFFVGRLGAEAVAVVGLTESLLTMVFAVAIGLSAATTAMVARRTGEKRPDAAARATVQALFVGFLAWVLTAVIGLTLPEQLLRFMNASPDVVAMGVPYTRIMLTGSLGIYYLFLINAAFRGAGAASIAMRSLWLANLVNIVLDPCLIFGWGPFPALGLTGAAIATTTGRLVGVGYQLWVLFDGRDRLALAWHHVRVHVDVLARLLRVAATGMLQYLIATASWLILIRLLAQFGSSAIAGYTIALRIFVFFLLPGWGMGNAAASLVGQNLGAGKPERAERSVWMAGRFNLVLLGSAAVVMLVFAEPMVRFFSSDPEVVGIGTVSVRIFACVFFADAFGLVSIQGLNGAGDTVTPSLINLVCYWPWQIPLAYLLALPLGLGPIGVLLAVLIAELTMSTLAILVFRRGAWKLRDI